MRCVNRPVLGHIIPQSAATEAAVEGSEFGFLTTCSACVSVRDSGEPQPGLLTPDHSWVGLIFFLIYSLIKFHYTDEFSLRVHLMYI